MLEHILAAARGLPAFTFQMSTSEARRAAKHLEDGAGPLTHLDVLALSAGVVETLFDDDVNTYSAAFHAQLIMMFQFPSVPELVVTQVAFGRAVGEESHRRLERIMAAAERRRMSVDDYVAELAARDAVPHDRPVRLFLGQARWTPDADRIRKAIRLLHRHRRGRFHRRQKSRCRHQLTGTRSASSARGSVT